MEAARAIFVCALIVFVAAVTANDDYQNEEPVAYVKAEKVTHLRFYLHDILSGANPTAVRVAQSNRTNDDKSPTPFGSVYAIDDHLRVGSEPNSTIIGNAQGLYLVSSQDPSKFTIVMYADFELTTGKFNGSSISVFSRNPVYLKQRDLAIVGGRGQFRMARGFVLVKTSYFNGTNGDAILQYTATIYHY